MKKRRNTNAKTHILNLLEQSEIALSSPEATLLLLGSVVMSKTSHLRKVPLLDYEKEKFN